jgi:error-prone DNA polymerase
MQLRLGFRMLGGFREAAAREIEAARREGPFVSLEDFTKRTRLGRAAVKQLAEADAFGSLAMNRRQALWQALSHDKKPKSLPLFDDSCDDEALPAALPVMSLEEEVFADYQTAGHSLRAHPISFHRAALNELGITPARNLAQLKNGKPVRVAGLVLLRQRPSTAKGITFVTLEDETGTINLVVHQRTWDRFYRIARRSPAWIAHGQLQAAESVIHVVVDRLEGLAEQLGELRTKSRDFR